MRSRQTGSAHIAIIIVLIIALFAALGIVFYQNFIAKNGTQSSTDHTTQQVKKDTVKTARMAFDGIIYALDYPNTWTVKTTRADGTSNASTLLTSPSQTVQVKFDITSGGIGGMCDPNSGLKVSYYKIYPSAAPKLTGQPLYVVETMYDAPDGGYFYNIGLTLDGGATHASIGDSYCNIVPVGIASSLVMDNGKVISPLIVANISFPKLTKDAHPVSEMQPIKDLLKTDDYKAAVKILGSARKE